MLVVDGAGVAALRVARRQSGANWPRKDDWAVVLNAPIRDADEIDACAIGVRALGTCPVKSKKTGAGSFDVPLAFWRRDRQARRLVLRRPRRRTVFLMWSWRDSHP